MLVLSKFNFLLMFSTLDSYRGLASFLCIDHPKTPAIFGSTKENITTMTDQMIHGVFRCCCVICCFNWPNPTDGLDETNPHTHCLYTTRE